MRASREGRHISGAERIIPGADDAPAAVAAFAARALNHPKGAPAEIHLTVEELRGEPLRLPALVREDAGSRSPAEAEAAAAELLGAHGIDAAAVWGLLTGVAGMRGAMIVDRRGRRLEPDPERGVRVSALDAEGVPPEVKDHRREAQTLATKVQACPGVLAEACISDDPDYVHGYVTVAGRYVALHHVKEAGAMVGGEQMGARVIVVDDGVDLPALFAWLEDRPVIVSGL
ncbi:6-carboxyhexanoate--CoA ligase [Corynebacterium sp. 335C]